MSVTAYDGKGQPVTDLTSAEFKIFDDGKLKPMVNFNAIRTPSAGQPQLPTTLILFDLLNTVLRQRDYFSTLLIHTLEPLERGDSVYFYLLTREGEVYPVHPLLAPMPTAMPRAGATADRGPATHAWTAQIRPTLTQAIQNVYGLKPKDEQDEGIRAHLTLLKLSELGDDFMRAPCPSSIVWITPGVPNWLDYRRGCKDAIFPQGFGTYLAGKCGPGCSGRVHSCIDYTPFLERFGAKFVRTDTMVYGVKVLAEGAMANRMRGSATDTREQLADTSGGRVYLNNEVEDAIAQSLQAVRTRYELTYDPPPPNGKYHKLRVECTRKGIHIAAPHGYTAEWSNGASPSNLRSASLMEMGFAITVPLARCSRLVVHRLTRLLRASFRPRLATTPLRFANPSPPSVATCDCV